MSQLSAKIQLFLYLQETLSVEYLNAPQRLSENPCLRYQSFFTFKRKSLTRRENGDAGGMFTNL